MEFLVVSVVELSPPTSRSQMYYCHGVESYFSFQRNFAWGFSQVGGENSIQRPIYIFDYAKEYYTIIFYCDLLVDDCS